MLKDETGDDLYFSFSDNKIPCASQNWQWTNSSDFLEVMEGSRSFNISPPRRADPTGIDQIFACIPTAWSDGLCSLSGGGLCSFGDWAKRSCKYSLTSELFHFRCNTSNSWKCNVNDMLRKKCKNILLSDYETQFHILQLTTSSSYTILEFTQKQNRLYVW